MQFDNDAFTGAAPQRQLKDRFEVYKPPGPEDRSFIAVLARGMDVLRAFRSHEGPLGNAELSELTGVPRATISRITHTLCELGYLVQLSNRGKYQLSVAMLALAYPVLSQSRVRQLARDILLELAKITGCTIALAAPNTDRTSMVYLDVFSGSSANTLRMDIGTRVGMGWGAIGRAFLAGLDGVTRQDYYCALEEANHDGWPELQLRIEAAQSQITQRGFCLVDGEWMKSARAVAVPLQAGQDGGTLALSCGAPNFAVSVEQLEQDLGPRLVHVANHLERLLGE